MEVCEPVPSSTRAGSVDSTFARRFRVSHAFTDLAGLSASAEDFLAAVLATAAQPIWVVDHDGLIRFANPAAIAALGYDSADELFGRDSHETIHYRHPDGTPYPAAECPMLLPRATGETVRSDLDWFFRRDGSMFPVSYVSAPIELRERRGAVVAFADIEDRLRAERVLSEHDAVLASREAALRRIAALVAGGAASPEVFAAIAREVAEVLHIALVVIWRNEPDRHARVVGAWGDRPHPFRAGTSWPVEERTIAALLPDVGRPARIEDFGEIGGMIPDAIAETGIRSGIGAAIVVEGELWGTMGAGVAESEPLPDHIEDRLAEFTNLVATAISSSASREALARLADEQAALRRVATLVAQGVPASELSGAVAEAVGRLLGTDLAGLLRYESDDTVTVLGGWSAAGEHVEVGGRWPIDPRGLEVTVSRTGRPARIDDLSEVPGRTAAVARDDLGIGSSVGCPIVVERRVWGALFVHSTRAAPLPADTESRLENFTELVATAIANLQARSELAASRARIAAAADAERRRVVRDLHDGAQQRLVHTVIMLKLARQALVRGDHAALDHVTAALDNAQATTAELRELAHGIMPAALTRGGLHAGVEALASRMPVPVANDVSVGRLAAAVEATAYFVVAETLTNVTKHAHARRAAVTARVEDGALRIQVRDDGVGGARPDGSGLLGLADRLAVRDGLLRVESPADGGTLIAADIPIPPSWAGTAGTSSRGSGLPHGNRYRPLAAQVGEHREHAPVLGGRGPQAELGEDPAHVFLHGGIGHDELLGDAGVRLALGHRREHLPLTRRELVEWTAGAAAAEHAADDLGIERAAAGGHALHGVDEARDVADALLEQVSDPLGAFADQVERVALLIELRQHEDARVRQLGPQLHRRAQAIVLMARRHLDVDDGDIGPVRQRPA